MGGSVSSATDSPKLDSPMPTESPKPDSPIPTDSNSPNPNMSSPESKTLESSDSRPSEQEPDQPTKERENGEEEEEEEEEEEGECGFCLFMKGGGCKEAFIEWEKCIEEGEKKKEEIVVKCLDVTGALKKCMEAHADYYEPILRAEKMAEEELDREVEAIQEKIDSKDSDNKPTSTGN